MAETSSSSELINSDDKFALSVSGPVLLDMLQEAKLSKEFVRLFENKETRVRNFYPPEERYMCDNCQASLFLAHAFCQECSFALCNLCITKVDVVQVGTEHCRLQPHVLEDLQIGSFYPMSSVLCVKNTLECLTANAILWDPNKMKKLPLHPRKIVGSIGMMEYNEEQSREIFCLEFLRGNPLVVYNADPYFTHDRWSLQRMIEYFERNNVEVRDYSVWPTRASDSKKFLDAFSSGTSNGRLKITNFPDEKHFRETSESRYSDFMEALPFKEYTAVDARYNLLSHLPTYHKKMDTGPKVFCSLATPLKDDKIATTAMHADVADALNICVYSSHPADATFPKDFDEWLDTYDCEYDTKMYVRERSQKKEYPAAVWHFIDYFKNVDDIREYLTTRYSKKTLENTHVIHANRFTLSKEDRLFLRHKKGVKIRTLFQYRGDVVLVPTGVIHQVSFVNVRNLSFSMKLAIDFMTPMRVLEVRRLAQDFQSLPQGHLNWEDKTEFAHVLYNSVSNLLRSLNLTY